MPQRLPSLNALRAFETVARCLSYQSAAQALHVSPAAVKQLVSKLESDIGAPLLTREGRGLRLTPRGEASLGELQQAMQHLNRAVQKMRYCSEEPALIVSAEPTFASNWLVPKLTQFQASHPNIQVLINSSPKLVDLQQGQADIAIRYAAQHDDELVVSRLFDEVICPACSPTLVAGPTPLSELAKVPIIDLDLSKWTWGNNTRYWYDWRHWLTHASDLPIDLTPSLQFNDYTQAIQAAIAGQGVVLASEPIICHALDQGLLVCPFKEKVTPSIGYDLVTSKTAIERPEVAAFQQWLLRLCQ